MCYIILLLYILVWSNTLRKQTCYLLDAGSDRKELVHAPSEYSSDFGEFPPTRSVPQSEHTFLRIH